MFISVSPENVSKAKAFLRFHRVYGLFIYPLKTSSFMILSEGIEMKHSPEKGFVDIEKVLV